MKGLFNISIALLFGTYGFCQEQDLTNRIGHPEGETRIISGQIGAVQENWIYLAAYEGDRFHVRDSIIPAGGYFAFTLPPDTPPGVFRLVYNEVYEDVLSPGRFIELIYNGRDLRINVQRDENGAHAFFEDSPENGVYQDFVNFQLAYEEALSSAYMELFPQLPGDAIYQAAVARYERLQEERLQYIDSLNNTYPGLYAVRIINAFRVPLIPGSMSHARRIDTLKQVFFELSGLDDPGLLHAPVYSFRIIDYLSIYRDASLDAEAQQDAFIEAADRIMSATGPEPELQSFVVDFLLQGFELLGMEQVLIHLADNYLDEHCTSDLAQLVEERMEGYRAMDVGQRVPDITLHESGDEVYSLSGLESEYVLLMFWASNCGHCRKMLPQLEAWYGEEHSIDLEIVALSIDASVDSLQHYLSGHPQPWISMHLEGGWDHPVASAYYIYATPSMYLLDRKRTIISRPLNFRQFQRAIRKL